VLRHLRLLGLSVALVFVFSACPQNDEDSPGTSDEATDKDHSHRWKDDAEGGKKEASRPEPAGAGGIGGGEGGTPSGEGEGLPVPVPEATIVHAELGPEDLARHYLMLGSAGDLSRIADYVDPRCFGGPIGRVDSVRMVGSLMTLDGLTLSLESQTATKATVKFYLIGGSTAGQKMSEISIEDEDLGESTTVITTSRIERRGWLDLVRIDGLWKVTCGFNYGGSKDGEAVAP